MAPALAWLKAHLPGLLVVVAVAAVARTITLLWLPPTVSEVLVAIAVGMLAANLRPLPAWSKPGVQLAVKRLLRAGIILLGARLSLTDVVAIGGQAIGVVVVVMALSLSTALVLGTLLKLPPRLCLLIGVGTAVCGNTAIIATAPIIQAEEREVSFAVATITLIGTAAVLLYPLIGGALHLGDHAFGMWCGVAINDTSQVVAASAAMSPAALDVATVVKLTRNAIMAPLLVVIALVSGRGAGVAKKGALNALPLFVFGFLALALLRTVGVIDKPTAGYFDLVAKALILCALAGVGLSTVVKDLRKSGVAPFALGLFTAVLSATVGLLLVQALHR